MVGTNKIKGRRKGWQDYLQWFESTKTDLIVLYELLKLKNKERVAIFHLENSLKKYQKLVIIDFSNDYVSFYLTPFQTPTELRKTIKRSLDRLEDKGFVKIEREKRYVYGSIKNVVLCKLKKKKLLEKIIENGRKLVEQNKAIEIFLQIEESKKYYKIFYMAIKLKSKGLIKNKKVYPTKEKELGWRVLKDWLLFSAIIWSSHLLEKKKKKSPRFLVKRNDIWAPKIVFHKQFYDDLKKIERKYGTKILGKDGEIRLKIRKPRARGKVTDWLSERSGKQHIKTRFVPFLGMKSFKAIANGKITAGSFVKFKRKKP